MTAPDTYVDRSVHAVVAVGAPGTFQRNLTVVLDPRNGRDAGAVLHELETHLLRLRMPGFRMGAKANIRVGGHDAASLDYASEDMSPMGPVKLLRRVVFVPVGERVIVATFTASEDEFMQFLPELDAMLASMKLS